VFEALPKNPSVDSGPAKGTSPEKRQTILNSVNAIISANIRLAFIAMNSKCNCPTCIAFKKITPHIQKILELGDQVKPVQSV
jgi:hypothetical protein